MNFLTLIIVNALIVGIFTYLGIGAPRWWKKTITSERIGIAYNAALKLCTILLYASGYRSEKSLAHYRTIQSLAIILGSERDEDVEYLEACRKKRNVVEYDYVGGATGDDVEELITFCKDLREDVLAWLSENYPHLLSTWGN